MQQGVAEDLLSRAEREDDLGSRLAAHYLIGQAMLSLGELRPALCHLEAAGGILDQAREGAAQTASGRTALVGVPAYLATVLLLLGRYDQARAFIALGLTEARRSGAPTAVAFGLEMALWFHLVLLDEEAPDLLAELESLIAERGFRYSAGFALMFRGLALARTGATQEGVALVREGVARHDAAGAMQGLPIVLARAAELAGDSESVALVDDAVARIEATGARGMEAELHRVRGVLLAEHGDAAGAEAHLLRAVDVARRQGAKHWELRAACDLARLRRDQGRVAEARGLLAPVYASTEGFGFPDLVEARALLEELGAAPAGDEAGRVFGEVRASADPDGPSGPLLSR